MTASIKARRTVTPVVAIAIAFALIFPLTAAAAEKFNDQATVEIQGMPGGGAPIYVLEKTGEDNGGNGIYRLFGKSGSRYLTAMKADEGQQVGWTSNEGEKGSEWILVKNSSGWSILARANAANAVTRSTNTASKLALQRNQGAKEQLWNIILK